MFRRCGPLWLSVLFLFAPVVSLAGTLPTSPGSEADRINALVHERGYDRPDAPGMSVIVVKDGIVRFKKAYGLADVAAGVPNTPRTSFRLASISKQFTAMAILILMEQGKLRLDNRLTDFFPDFPAYGREITIRHLLNHTSGLLDYVTLVPANQKQQLTDADVLRILEQQERGNFLPGTKFEYSNSGVCAVGPNRNEGLRRAFLPFPEHPYLSAP